MPRNHRTHEKKEHRSHSHKHKRDKKYSEEDEFDYNDGQDDIEDFSQDKRRDNRDEYDEQENYDVDDDEPAEPKVKLAKKTKDRLKRKIVNWLNNDDKIKQLNAKMKKYKEAKKGQEDVIIKMITKLGMEDSKIDIQDEQQNIRSRVYRYKSITKGSLKEDIIKDALMEAIRDEKKVDQLVKKIENKRPINERYYLKRTKGNKDE